MYADAGYHFPINDFPGPHSHSRFSRLEPVNFHPDSPDLVSARREVEFESWKQQNFPKQTKTFAVSDTPCVDSCIQDSR